MQHNIPQPNDITMTFLDRLRRAWTASDSLLTVGLDPDLARLPAELQGRADAILTFCCGVVDATAPYACSIKPQIAYFSAAQAEDQLQDLCAYIRTTYPHLPLILDAKRGDVGSTAEQYAREAFERYQADALTVNPYLGLDSVEPYLAWSNKGILVLCRTSNSGGADIQCVKTDQGEPLYLHVAKLVAERWNRNQQCGLVVGATFPDDIRAVRACVGNGMPLLIPGIGAQGGDVAAAVHAGCDTHGTGMMINSSRAILYASSGEDWREAAARVACATRDAIRAARIQA